MLKIHNCEIRWTVAFLNVSLPRKIGDPALSNHEFRMFNLVRISLHVSIVTDWDLYKEDLLSDKIRCSEIVQK